MKNIRTDLALESKEIFERDTEKTSELTGVEASENIIAGFKVTNVKIIGDDGAKKLNKPIGTYITVELDSYLRREDDSFVKCVETVSEEIRKLINVGNKDSVLIASLGNDKVTPDAIGPMAADNIMATNHLVKAEPEMFGMLRPVSVISVGVMGITGIESSEIISAVTERISPSLIIAIDALASSSIERLCRTIQITNTGISPGSGVGNNRKALNSDSMGIPVIAVGVPTVVDADTMFYETASKYNIEIPDNIFENSEETSMFVTQKEIDSRVADISKVIGYAVNMALHDDLTIADMDMFLS